jgi:hypothetical protein
MFEWSLILRVMQLLLRILHDPATEYGKVIYDGVYYKNWNIRWTS